MNLFVNSKSDPIPYSEILHTSIVLITNDVIIYITD